MNNLNSRQRLLRAIGREDVDYIPCSFMSFAILREKFKQDRFAAAKAELEMGLDPMLFIPSSSRFQRKEHPDLRGLPVRFDPQVRTKTWLEGGLSNGRLFKEYQTPAGTLRSSVRLSEDWPHGEFLPFVDDYQIPRADKPLVNSRNDLEALRFLLMPPQEDDIHAYKVEAAIAGTFADENHVLLAGGWGVGMDMANWLCGMQNLMILMMEDPQFVSELLEMIHIWNMKRMEVVLSEKIDLYIRRAWYEGCDFVVPKFFQKEILPRIKKESALVHEHGAKFGYICSSGTKPMLDLYTEAGIDVLIGVDPIEGTYTDMPLMKEKLGREVCLWGGVSAAVTVERGNEDEIRSAVRHAMDTLGPKGFILSPVDNLTINEPKTWENIDIFINEWKSHR